MTNLPPPLNLRKGGGGESLVESPRAREGETLDCHDLLKGKFRNDDLEAIRRLSRFAIRKDLQNAFFANNAMAQQRKKGN